MGSKKPQGHTSGFYAVSHDPQSVMEAPVGAPIDQAACDVDDGRAGGEADAHVLDAVTDGPLAAVVCGRCRRDGLRFRKGGERVAFRFLRCVPDFSAGFRMNQ